MNVPHWTICRHAEAAALIILKGEEETVSLIRHSLGSGRHVKNHWCVVLRVKQELTCLSRSKLGNIVLITTSKLLRTYRKQAEYLSGS